MIRSFIVAAAIAFGASSFAQQAQVVEGRDYFRLKQVQATQAPKGQVEVMELFSYGCIHCANFEPMLNEWKQRKPANVSFRREHVVFEDKTRNLARAYHALVAMKKIDTAHPVMFEDVKQSRMPVSDLQLLANKLAKSGIDSKTFLATANSFSVTQKVKRTESLQSKYELSGTPEFIVNGKYRVTIRQAGTPDEGRRMALQAIDFLVQKEAIESAAAATAK
jgi:protein dithiol oxidoreductase (disulfide-forming)